MFSVRVRQDLVRNRLAVALERRRNAGQPVIDLTESNPTRAGFDYPARILQCLAHSSALGYEPHPFGMPAARAAVSADFNRRGVDVPPDRIVLTASTSEAYSLLFKLLCNPGDSVLAPRPSYPLVEQLTDLDAVSVRHFPLDVHGCWSIDTEAVARELADPSARVRAIILVSPNNPTGSIVKREELATLAALAQEHDAALIVDEVFADYPLGGARIASALTQCGALTFALGGLSKSVGLPQMKLGWIGINGPADLVAASLERLEIICDAYLSVATPVQVAAGDLMRDGAQVREQIHRRVRANYGTLREVGARHRACSVLPAEAGWYAVVQIPAIQPEEAVVIDLLERTGVLVQPGYFFDFEREAFLVVSLLPPPALFASAATTLFTELERLA